MSSQNFKLGNTKNNINNVNKQIYMTKNVDKLADNPHNSDNIYMFTQFFIHSDNKRNIELKYCLKENVKTNYFAKIYLMNERLYTKEELGLNETEMSMIQQIIIGERLEFGLLFFKVSQLKINGYIVFCNSDMFFDKTLLNVHRSSLSIKKGIYTLLRFEYLKEKKLGYCKLFNHPSTNAPRPDSQDVWIYHTNFSPNEAIIETTNFEFGMPGCDNKITLIFDQNNYVCYNEPWKVKTYHYHMSQIRNYSHKDILPPPYLYVEPNI